MLSLIGIATAATLAFFGERPFAIPPTVTPSTPETIQDKINQDVEVVGITDDQLTNPLLTPGSHLQLSQSVNLSKLPQGTGNNGANNLGQLPPDAIVQVLTRQEPAAEQARWVKLKVCANPPPGQSSRQLPTHAEETGPPTSALDPAIPDAAVTTPKLPPLNSGAVGWVLEAQLAKVALAAEELNCPPE